MPRNPLWPPEPLPLLPRKKANLEALLARVPGAVVRYLDSWPTPHLPEVSWGGHVVRVGEWDFWDAATGQRSYSVDELLGTAPRHHCVPDLCGCSPPDQQRGEEGVS